MTARCPRVSIVVPSFHQARYLEATIRSALDQDYPALELLVIDGGSTDGSVEIIRQYAPRLAYWESGPDRGQCHAINKGLARARGEIVAWLNSDDLLLPGAVQAAVAALAACPEAALVYADGLWIDEAGGCPQSAYARQRPAAAGRFHAPGRP
jgi:glycosyltransferase involved in cell wall biosynthesis